MPLLARAETLRRCAFCAQRHAAVAFVRITRGRMPEAASDTLAENPLSASRGRGRYILKKTGQPALVRVTYGRVPKAASSTSEEKPSSTSRVGRHCIPKKRRRSLPLPESRAGERRKRPAIHWREKPSSASRVGRHCILKKRRRSLPLPASRVRMLEAASDALAKKPSFASREGRWDILKRRRSLPFLPRAREDAGGGQRYIGGKALVRVTRRRALHP